MEENWYCTLRLFRQHLPDPNQDLFIEQWRNTQSFCDFPRLPIELRLIIWRFTYPVYLDGHYVNIDPIDEIGEWNAHAHDPRRRKEDPLPVSLYVNHESRTEALRHFCIFHQSPPPGHGRPLKPLCFYPAEDTLSFDSGWIFGNGPGISSPTGPERYRTFKNFLSELSSQFSTHTNKVKFLSMGFRHLWTDPRSLRKLFNKNTPTGDIVEGDPYFYSAMIFHFPALEYFLVEYCPFCSFGFKDIMADMEAFLEENKHRFKSGKPPILEVIEFGDDHSVDH
jgi:hypothetical protein